MRAKASKDGISVHAIAGTDVVTLALDATEPARRGLLGFAFHRAEEGVSGDGIRLEASKVFEASEPDPDRGQTYPTNLHPMQSFL